MTTEQVLETLLVAVIGSGGVVGVMFKLAYRYLDKRLTQNKQGRCFFWLYKAIVDGHHNGDLEHAFADLQAAEDEKKELDQRILAKHTIDEF